jgi:chromosome segregation ATPase
LAIALMLLSAQNIFALSFAPQALRSPAQSEKQILEQCRAAIQELTFRRESEELLKKKVAEVERVSGLKDERIEILQKSIAEYEKAIEARKKAESAVEALRQNYEAQIKSVEGELARARRNGRWLAVGGFVLGAALAIFANRN